MNALARASIEQNLEFKFLTSKQATDWLSARMAEARKQVEGPETALQKYREQNDAISLEDAENIVVPRPSWPTPSSRSRKPRWRRSNWSGRSWPTSWATSIPT